MSVSNFFLYICSFIFIYNIPFTHSPLSGSKLMIIFMIFWLTMRGKHFVIKKPVLKPVYWMIVLLLYSLGSVFLQHTGDFGLVYAEVLFLLNHVLGCLLLINIFQNCGKATIYDILHMMVVIAFVQSVIIILSMLIAPFNDFISSIAFIEGRDDLQFRYGYARGYGLAASVTYDLAVCQAFAIMFIPYLMDKTLQKKKKIFYVLATFPILFSILTLGRTGLVGVGLALIFIVKDNAKISSKTIKISLYLFATAMIGAAFLLGNDSLLIKSINTYVFEGVDKIFTIGKLQTETGGHLVNMLKGIKEWSFKTWIWGDARYSDDWRYYGHTDIGFMRDILYFGLIGAFILFIVYVHIYKIIQKKTEDRRFHFLMKLFFIFLLVAHFKGEFLLSCGTGICILLMIAFSVIFEDSEATFSEDIYIRDPFI